MAADRENLAELVALGSTIRDAAETLGIPEQAAYKITSKPDFKPLVYSIRTERTEGLSAQALGAAEESITQLRAIASAAEKDSDRIAACKAILAQVLPLAENTELRRRLDEIERGAAEADREARESRPGDDGH